MNPILRFFSILALSAVVAAGCAFLGQHERRAMLCDPGHSLVVGQQDDRPCPSFSTNQP